ncbi:MAG: putative lipase, GDSL-type [Candidatus Kaiserbacteria bacterium]|nr:putative lipase, GDSL-type [Candidatus Kaiserbacteria bacterium]
MQKRTCIVAGTIMIVVIAGVYFVFPRNSKITNYPTAQTGPIVAFGDSLVYGTGSTQGHDFVSVLSQKVQQPITNMGRPGDTTAQGIARIPEVQALHPRIVILLLGGNDYLQRVPMDTTFANLKTIISTFQKEGIIVVLLGVRGGVLVDHFASPFADLASQTKSAYVSDVLDGLIGHKDLMSDEVHPNDIGYARIADKVYPVLKSVLQ